MTEQEVIDIIDNDEVKLNETETTTVDLLSQLKTKSANSVNELFDRLNKHEALKLVSNAKSITRNKRSKTEKLQSLTKLNKMLNLMHNTSSSFTNIQNDYSPEIDVSSLNKHLNSREVNTLYRAARSSLTGVRSKNSALQAIQDLSNLNSELIDLFNIAKE